MENPLKEQNEGRQNKIDLPNLLQRFHAIAERAKNGECVNGLIEHSKAINEKTRHLSIIGTAEWGLLNDLLHVELFGQTTLPIVQKMEVAASNENENPYLIINEQRHPLERSFLTEPSNGQPIKVFIDDPWIRENNVVIKITPYPEIVLSGTDAAFSFFSNTDFVVFLTDALSAITRNEINYFKECADKKIPFLVGISRLGKVDEDEREGVKNYVKGYLAKHFDGTSLIQTASASEAVSGSVLFKLAEESLNSLDLRERRLDFFISWLTYCLFSLRNSILDKQAETNLKIQQIKQIEIKEKMGINDQYDQWSRIANILVEKRQEIEKQLRDHLVKNRKIIMDNLLFELGRSNDAKTSWERDLPFFINRELKNTADRLNTSLQKQILESLQWLYDEIVKTFNYKIPVSKKITASEDTMNYIPSELGLTNTQKLRMKARYGNALTIIGAATAFVSAPIGGITIATSIIYQALVDQHIISKTKKEKEQIKNELYKVIESIELKFVNEFASRLKTNFDDIIASLKVDQTKWLAEKIKTAENKTANDINLVIENADLGNTLDEVNTLLAELS